MFCTQCGSRLSDDAKFCSFCGTKIGIENQRNSETAMLNLVSLKCPDCGSPLDFREEDTVILCSYCGNNIRIERNIQGKVVGAKLCLISSNLDSLLQRANEYLTAEQYEYAANLFHKVLNIEVDNADATEGLERITEKVFEKAEALFEDGYVELAIKEYRSSLLLAPWIVNKVKSRIEFFKDYTFLTFNTKELIFKKVVCLKYEKLVVYDKHNKENKRVYDLKYIKKIKHGFWSDNTQITYCEKNEKPKDIKLALSSEDEAILIKAIDDARKGTYREDPRVKILKKKIQEESKNDDNDSKNVENAIEDTLFQGIKLLKGIKKSIK